MSSLSDKLRALGVQVGASRHTLQTAKKSYTADPQLGGRTLSTVLGATYVIETDYPAVDPLRSAPPALRWMSIWCGDERIDRLTARDFVFLDTETTGLSGGAGTYAFLIGVGRFEDDHFHLTQFFMRDPAEEPALLVALEGYLTQCSALVTFNGKAFDVPLLTGRYTIHGWQNPLATLAHIDLLPLARRLWKDRLPSRTLGNLEYHILGISRTAEDIPGWMIPEIYFEYLRSGETEQLRNVIYHNAMDVVSLAALFNHSASLLTDPSAEAAQHDSDMVALAKLFESLGDPEAAIDLYRRGLERDIPIELRLQAISKLALIYKRRRDFVAARLLWESAVQYQHIEACIELAKYYEHRQKDFRQALHWTETAIGILNAMQPLSQEQRLGLRELEHRKERLQRKISARSW